MILKTLSHTELLTKLHQHVNAERRELIEVLHCFREAEDRRLHAIEGCSSLLDFCIKKLGYDGGQAHRRIEAMRLLRTLPDQDRLSAEEKLLHGKITLSNLSLLQKFIRVEGELKEKTYTQTETIELIESAVGISKQKLEKKLAVIQPGIVKSERERVVTENLTEIRFVASEELLEKFNRVKEILSHTDPRLSYADLFNRVVSEFLERKDPVKKAQKPMTQKTRKQTDSPNPTPTPPQKISPAKSNTVSGPDSKPRSRYIPAPVSRAVWKRDEGKCTFKHPESGIRCDSKFKIQLDHVIPFSQGGGHAVDNLRLRCQQHNLLHAEESGLGRWNDSFKCGG